MARNFALTVDVSQLNKLGTRLGAFTSVELAESNVAAVNEVVDRTYDLARDKMTAGINLTDEYLRRRMRVEHANNKRARATITAAGDRSSMTTLATYPVAVRAVTRKGPSRARVFTPLGVGAGQRQMGLTTSVTKGSSDFWEHGFLMPLKAGQDNGYHGYGVFARTKAGKIKHRYGPSVYQLFSYQAKLIVDDVQEDLESTAVRMAEEHMQKVFAE